MERLERDGKKAAEVMADLIEAYRKEAREEALFDWAARSGRIQAEGRRTEG
jgi:hypothetical protein